MIRTWLILVVVIGVLSSGLSRCGGQVDLADKSAHTTTLDSSDIERIRTSGRYNGGSSDDADTMGDAVMLHREYDGHFYADAEVNGATVHMLVDTGATAIALTRDDARKAGIGISIGMPNVVGQGASGDVRGEYVTVDRIKLGDKTGEAMNAVVLDGGGVSLLGQTFLSKFDSVEIHGDTMVLR
jgi:aspartyl protease family protein